MTTRISLLVDPWMMKGELRSMISLTIDDVNVPYITLQKGFCRSEIQDVHHKKKLILNPMGENIIELISSETKLNHLRANLTAMYLM